MDAKYAPLFQPITVGRLKLKNRISMAPMYTRYASVMGEVTERLIEHHVRKARGGVGMIVIENTCIEWEYGRIDGCPVTIHSDRYVHGLHELAAAVQRHDVAILTQLQHVGRQQVRANIEGRQPIAPSAVQSRVGGDMPRAMSEEEIQKAIRDYAEAARRTKEAGFNGVEIHGAHGYLPAQFISPLTNRRTDRWGGSFENRGRFSAEVVRAVRAKVGSDFPIFFRFSAEEWNPGSLSLEEGLKYAQRLESEGVDCLDVTGGYYETVKHFTMQGDPFDALLYLAAAVKSVVKIPVIGVGSLGWDPDIAAEAIRGEKADIVHFGRELLADPDLPLKIAEGRIDEIRRCIRCNECLGCLDRHCSVSCAINPEQGYEYKRPFSPAASPKKIVVVGAGLAGMEFAITARGRGHEVVLLERDPQPGGLARKALAIRYKRPEIKALLDYYQTMLRKSGVDFRPRSEATGEGIQRLKPDLVVVTVGAKPAGLAVPGADKARLAVEALQEEGGAAAEKVCVVGGSGVGIDAAITFAEKGSQVVLLEQENEVGRELPYHLRVHIMQMLDRLKVEILRSHRVEEITADGVIAEKEGKRRLIPCSTVLVAAGFRRTDVAELETGLRAGGIAFVRLGSREGAGRFTDAIHSGFWSAIETDRYFAKKG